MMTSDLTLDALSIHSSSSSSSSISTIIQDKYVNKSLLLSCCGCNRICNTKVSKSVQTNEISNIIERKSFFKRIQFFKAQKRKTSARKQQQNEIPSSPLSISDGHPLLETERTVNESNEKCLNKFSSSTSYKCCPDISMYGSNHQIQNSQSIPYLNQLDTKLKIHNIIDSYSFTDIEIGSSINEETNERRCLNPSSTPQSVISHTLSLTTTNLSAHSSQSLLRRLLDKAQILDDYYNEIVNKGVKHPLPSSTSLSSSSNSLLGRPKTVPGPFLYRFRSNDSFKKSTRKRYYHIHDSISPDSSQCHLYMDEDNVLRELIRFNNDIDVILSRLEMEGEDLQEPSTSSSPLDRNLTHPIAIDSNDDIIPDASPKITDQQQVDPNNLIDIIAMRTDISEVNIHLLLSSDIDRLRETALLKLLKMVQEVCHLDHVHSYETITLAKLNKLPKSTTWKGKRVFGVPLRIYQQTTGHILPTAIVNALQYIRVHASKCDGLFRKPGVKSKIDQLRTQIERTNDGYGESFLEAIEFDEYQPFVVADVIRQYFRELPECIIPPSITRLLCDLLKCATPEEQSLAIRYVFLILPDENREVLETILRFLLDISIRSGNNQITCRNLARIFLPSVFQSFYDIHNKSSSKILWWKWRKEKLDTIQQENERLVLEHCLMAMILNVDLLCRVPNTLTDELKLMSPKKMKRLEELICDVSNGQCHMKKYISKNSEVFLERLSKTKFKTVQTNIDGVNVSMYKSPMTSTSDIDENNLPTWKCSIDIPNASVKQVYQRIFHEFYLWNNHFAESRIVEKIDKDKEIVQYIMSFLDFIPVRSFCEFRFSKKVSLRSLPDADAILVSAISIDHTQNHFLPGSIGIVYDMHYYIKPSATQNDHTTVIQIACIDFSGRSTQWYENVCGSFLARNLVLLRNTFTKSKV